MTAVSFLERMWATARGTEPIEEEAQVRTHRLLSEKIIAAKIQDIGESIEIFYEPRNVGHEWYVGLCDHHGHEMPIHEHFAGLLEGLDWLKSASMRELGVIEQSEFGDGVGDASDE